MNVTNWGLRHKGPWDKISGWGFFVACVCVRETETDWERVRRSSGLSSKPWQTQTGCTILRGRFNYKWCFLSDPSWNPLFFRRSSPNPQQGLAWPASKVICPSRIVCHALWMMRRRHSCPNFAESGVNTNTWADRMLISAHRKEQDWVRFYRA